MRAIKSRRLRRQAREACDPTITRMLAKIYKREAVIAPFKDPEGKPIVLQPESFVSTAFWPQLAYRRVLKCMKRGGRVTGERYDANARGVV